MAVLRRAIWLNASVLATRQARTSITRFRLLPGSVNPFRSHVSTCPRQQQARQLQSNTSSNTPHLQSSLDSAARTNPQTLTEKIVQLHADGLGQGRRVRAGDYVMLRPHKSMTHDNSFPVITKFMEMGAISVSDNRQVVMALDHDVQNESDQNLRKYRLIEEFANKHGIDFCMLAAPRRNFPKYLAYLG
ncbi:homoaconitase precursor [Metarhizium acridum CQMa 102]|uniref:Homoaconitase n=1 Tax=Metarhizium acridum (strain CQMa 102) TaxID=655827 RepID=E9EGK9_METAQ|nr:homoaconitase precursor [Metarhizium acridum CQMa 102]EFY84932.1 homoaconitase precursor [Metarhizium acridum CQMa 102]